MILGRLQWLDIVTSGSRNSPSIMWSKNLLRKPTTQFESPSNLQKSDFNCSSVCVFFYFLYRCPRGQQPIFPVFKLSPVPN